MTPRERQTIITTLVRQSGAALESFFRSHDLASAYRLPSEGWGREKRVNEALDAAAARGDLDAVLQDAVRHFALAEQGKSEPIQLKANRAADSSVLGLARLERLHPWIKRASGDLLRDGHSAAAV